VNYRAEVAEARRRRDALIEQATAEARETIARAAAVRDAEIKRLRADGLSYEAIAPLVGCSKSLVFELLSAERHERYTARRRKHWRHLRAVA
jgi:DNA invertase Pin-like site-specific DNA recombinase